MRKILILLGLLLTLSLSGQIIPGIMNSQSSSATCDDGMLNNGCFTSSNYWTLTSGFTITNGTAVFDDVAASATLTQTGANMGTQIETNSNYRLTFTLALTGTARGIIYNDLGDQDYVSYRWFTAGANSFDFSTAGYVGGGGIQFYFDNGGTGTATISNVKLIKL